MEENNDKIILEVIGDDIDKFIRIRKANGDYFTYKNNVQFYIDSYEGIHWDENEVEALIKFLGFDIFKITKR